MAGVKFDITGNANGFVNAARQAEAAAGKMGKSVTNEGKALDDMFKKLAGGMATMAAGLSASALTKKIFDIRSEFQQLEVAFSTMLKSKEKANKLMKDATEFAATTPFDLKGVAAGIKQNLAYGASVDTVIDEMRMLGDVAAGVSMPLNDLVYLYGTLRTSGRVATIDIRQFAGRGIPIYEELAKVLGVAKNEVAGLVTAGKVSFSDIEKAFKNMTSAGGMFNNLMANQSKTLQGQFSNLKDNIEMMFNEIGQKTQGVMGDSISLAGKLVENYETVGRALSVLVATYGTYKAAVIAVAAVEKAQVAAGMIKHFLELTKVMKTATAMQVAFNSAAWANPYVLAAAAVAALVAGVVALTKHKKAEAEAHKAASREVAKEYNEVNTLANKLKDTNAKEEERAKALSRLKEIAPDVVAGIDSEKDSLEKLNEKLGEYNTMKQIEITLKASSQYIDFTESLQSLSDAKAEMQKQKTEMENLWLDLSPKITAAIESGDVSPRLAEYFKEFLYDPNVEIGEKLTKVYDKYWDMNKLRIQYGKSSSYVDEGDFSFMKGLMTESKKDVNDFRQLTTELSDAESDYTTAVEELRKRISNTIALFITDADKAKEAEETMLKALGLADSGSTTTGNGTPEEKALTEKQKENEHKRKKAKEKATERLAKLTRDLNYKVAQADIDSMEDGYAKAIKTLEHNLKVEEDTIKDKRAELLKQKEDEALKKWLAEDPENRKEYQFVYKGGLTKEEEAVFIKMGEQARKMFDKGVADANKKYAGEARLFIEQLSVDSMLEGSDKDKAQRELDNAKELHDIEAQRDAYIEAARAVWVFNEAKKTGKDAKELVDLFDVDKATKDFDALFEKYKEKQSQQQLDSEVEALQNYYIEYGNFKEKIWHLEQQYNDKIAKAKTEGERLSLIAERDKVLDELKKSQDASYQNIFKDPTKMSLSSVKNAIKLAREEIKKITSKGILNEDDIENVQRLQEALDRLQSHADSAPFAGFGDGLDGVVSKFNNILAIRKRITQAQADGNEKAKMEAEDELAATTETLKKNLAGVGVDAFTNGLYKAAEAMKEIATISGDVQLGEAAEQVMSITGNLSAAAQGAASGGWIGAIVGGVTNFIDQITTAFTTVKLEEAELEKNTKDFIYEISRLQYKLGDSYESFAGTDEMGRAVDAREKMLKGLKDYSDMVDDLNSNKMPELYEKQEEFLSLGATLYLPGILGLTGHFAGLKKTISNELKGAQEAYEKGYSQLEAMQVKTKDNSGFANLMGFKDQYTSLKDLAPQLWGEDGVFSIEKAKIFLDTNTQLNEDQRKTIQNLIDLKEAADEAQAELDGYLDNLFGQWGDNLTEAISNAVLTGADAWDEFGDTASDTIKKIGKQMIYSAFFKETIENFKEPLQNAVGDAEAMALVTSNFMNALKADSEAAQGALKAYYDSAESLGFNIYDSDRTATSKGTIQASQDSVDQVLGIATNIQSHTFSIHNDIKQVVNINSQILSSVRNIESNTDRLIDIESDLSQLRSDMSDMATKGIKVRA